MPIRLVCPSCSAALSVKDEYAGRAVKCPKCAGVIPASQPGAAPPAPSKAAMPALPPPPPPEPEPQRSPFEALDEPEKPKPKIAARATAKPAPKAADPEDDRDDEPVAKKAKKRDEDDGDEPAPKAKKRRGGDDEDDRPAKKKRRGDDEDDDGDGPKKKKKGGMGLVVGILAALLLLCCLPVGYGGYWMYTKVQKAKDDIVEGLEKANFRVNKFSYDDLKVGTTTRADAELALGAGRTPTTTDLEKIYGTDKSSIANWQDMNAKNRVLLWQNGDDYILAAFHPNAEGNARLQMKSWKPKNPPGASSGSSDDAAFVAQYPAGKVGGGEPGGGRPGGGQTNGPPMNVTAVELAQAYNADPVAAGTKYLLKVIVAEGKVHDVDYTINGDLAVTLDGAKKGDDTTRVRVLVAKGAENRVLSGLVRGQTVKMKGKVDGYIGFGNIDLKDGTFESSLPDGVTTVTAAALFNEYAKDPDATDAKYKDKPIVITFANVERKDGDSTLIITPPVPKKVGAVPPATRIQVFILSDDNFKKQLANVKAGDRVMIKGEYAGSFENKINIGRAWLSP